MKNSSLRKNLWRNLTLLSMSVLVCIPMSWSQTASAPIKSTDECRMLSLLNHYFAITYPGIIPPKYLLPEGVTGGDQSIIRNNDTFYRFLSMISGLPTPYNQIPGNIRVEGNDWIYCRDHINLVSWYADNIDHVSCEEFLEYYNLVHYQVPYPYGDEEWSDYVDRIGVYIDSIQRNLKIFENRYQPNKEEKELLFPWKTNYTKEDMSKIKSLINTNQNITLIIKTR